MEDDNTVIAENIKEEKKQPENVCECIRVGRDEAKDDYVGVPISVRLRSWPVWLALLGSVGIILNSSGVFAKWGLDTDGWNAIVNALGGVFIALGVVNNPTDRKHF